MWPCITFSTFPGCRGIFCFSFVPSGPETTRQVFAHYSPDGETTETEKAAVAYFREILGPEDVALVESVQKGLHSRGMRGLWISHHERRIRNFHHWYEKYMGTS